VHYATARAAGACLISTARCGDTGARISTAQHSLPWDGKEVGGMETVAPTALVPVGRSSVLRATWCLHAHIQPAVPPATAVVTRVSTGVVTCCTACVLAHYSSATQHPAADVHHVHCLLAWMEPLSATVGLEVGPASAEVQPSYCQGSGATAVRPRPHHHQHSVSATVLLCCRATPPAGVHAEQVLAAPSPPAPSQAA
jgi:hypothetical protein